MTCAGGATHSQQAYSQIIIHKSTCPHTYASGFRYEYLTEDLKFRGRYIGGQGTTGDRSRRAARYRKGAGYIYGTIQGYVSPGDFLNLLPLMIGDSVVSTTFSLADALPYFGVLVDRDYGTFEYQNCMVDEWLLQSRAPELGSDDEPDLLYLTMNIIGSREDTTTAWPGSPPALGSSAAFSPLILADSTGAVTLGGSVRPIEAFSLQMKNYMYARYVNSLYPASLNPRDRMIGLRVRLPWISANDDLYEASEAGAAASLVFTNGAVSTTFSFANVKLVDNSPTGSRHKQEIPLELEGIVSATSAGNELVITNDSTP